MKRKLRSSAHLEKICRREAMGGLDGFGLALICWRSVALKVTWTIGI